MGPHPHGCQRLASLGAVGYTPLAAWIAFCRQTPNFKIPQIEAMILRGIAWAAHYPVDTLVNGTAPVRGGGRGRRGEGGTETPAAPGRGRGGQ
jgi:hypothetical protein